MCKGCRGCNRGNRGYVRVIGGIMGGNRECNGGGVIGRYVRVIGGYIRVIGV